MRPRVFVILCIFYVINKTAKSQRVKIDRLCALNRKMRAWTMRLFARNSYYNVNIAASLLRDYNNLKDMKNISIICNFRISYFPPSALILKESILSFILFSLIFLIHIFSTFKFVYLRDTIVIPVLLTHEWLTENHGKRDVNSIRAWYFSTKDQLTMQKSRSRPEQILTCPELKKNLPCFYTYTYVRFTRLSIRSHVGSVVLIVARHTLSFCLRALRLILSVCDHEDLYHTYIHYAFAYLTRGLNKFI